MDLIFSGFFYLFTQSHGAMIRRISAIFSALSSPKLGFFKQLFLPQSRDDVKGSAFWKPSVMFTKKVTAVYNSRFGRTLGLFFWYFFCHSSTPRFFRVFFFCVIFFSTPLFPAFFFRPLFPCFPTVFFYNWFPLRFRIHGGGRLIFKKALGGSGGVPLPLFTEPRIFNHRVRALTWVGKRESRGPSSINPHQVFVYQGCVCVLPNPPLYGGFPPADFPNSACRENLLQTYWFLSFCWGALLKIFRSPLYFSGGGDVLGLIS